MKKLLLFILISSALCISFLFSACKKEIQSGNDISFLSINNATLNSLNFSVGGDPINASLLPRGASTGYAGVYEGTWDLQASISDALRSTITKKVILNGNEHTSIYVIKPDSLQFFTINDDPTVRDPNRAKIKFLNLSPDAQSLSLDMILLNSTKSFPDVNYKSYTTYQDFDEKSTYSIILKDNNASVPLILETEENFEKGKIYTIWTTGFLNTTVPADRLTLHITEVK